ncbi:Sorting nexin mvp1 [Penicillium rubens]|uniref:Sorting nexin MVP1 n=2 Tax=Penicillium chrysogenum species complex TaxID=254878 RepID=B6HJY9_PENRW|nr:Sorting nexin mvp1 [Penicillium rubens]KAJ5049997.1 Sorting nexin mvp1 [Penicillium rubens]KZN89533.1 Sorting nexin [Penicillium chrysogenum]CAP96888.1 Pc21g19910 [Penicillium rubens Wisconsin 54-1255]
MSLFGTSPEDPSAGDPARSKSSLFADEPATGGSSLFADDDGDDSSSPWNAQHNTAKRTARRDLVRTLLPNTDVPESYIDAYDLILNSGDRVGSGIGLTSVREILSSSELTATDQSKILNLVASGDHESFSGLGRGEFNVLLALVGLAQEGEDLSFDAVDDRRKKLPQPKSGYLDRLRMAGDASSEQPYQRPATPPSQPPPLQTPGSTQSQRLRRPSLGGLESDPWGSPELHRGHNHEVGSAEPRILNGFGSVRSTTNAWSSKPIVDTTQSNAIQREHSNGQTEVAPPSSSGSGWGNNNFSGAGPSDESSFGGTAPQSLGGFGPAMEEPSNITPRRRSLGLGRSTNPQVEETVTVTLLPEKEGLFMFQHRNYEVKSARRGSTVIRRYSDFVWLLDCLQKRFPFRQLPLLPPKRVSVNGTHLSADSSSFLEKRRHGLVRFTNALVRHPVLGQEQLVIMFLTVPTELSVWRKQATISVQDEFVGRVLPPDLEDSLPATLDETFETVRSGVKRSAEIYINLCTLLERLAKRNDGLAADHLRFSLALQSLTEVTKDTYAVDTSDIPSLNAGITATARHLSTSQSLLEDEARGWTEGVLEDLKQQRDCLVSVREMFDRRDRYARNNIAQLERRIETSEQKLQDLRARPSGTVKPGEIEKVEDSIFKDKESIVQQHARGVFIKECIRDELVHFQQSQYHISRLHQDWSQERVKYSELQADNWRGLSDEVERMPTGV